MQKNHAIGTLENFKIKFEIENIIHVSFLGFCTEKVRNVSVT